MLDPKKRFMAKMLQDASGGVGADLKAKYGPKPPPPPSPAADPLAADSAAAPEPEGDEPPAFDPSKGLTALPPEVIDVLKAIIAANEKPATDAAPPTGV